MGRASLRSTTHDGSAFLGQSDGQPLSVSLHGAKASQDKARKGRNLARFVLDRSKLPLPEQIELTQQKLGAQGSAAEVAIIDPNDDFCGKRLGIFEHDDVEGYCTPARVVEILNQVIKLP